MTPMPATLPGFHADRFQEFLADRDEPEWSLVARAVAFDHYQRMLAVPLDAEEWRRVRHPRLPAGEVFDSRRIG